MLVQSGHFFSTKFWKNVPQRVWNNFWHHKNWLEILWNEGSYEIYLHWFFETVRRMYTYPHSAYYKSMMMKLIWKLCLYYVLSQSQPYTLSFIFYKYYNDCFVCTVYAHPRFFATEYSIVIRYSSTFLKWLYWGIIHIQKAIQK